MSQTPAAPSNLEATLTAVDAGFDRALTELKDLVRIPSVSWDGFDQAHVEASAQAVADLFNATGLFPEVSVVRHKVGDYQGRPAIIARRPARGNKPTVLLYAHHDVQPEGDLALWDTPPYEPTTRGDRLFGRGAADDKAGVVLHLASLRALLEVAGPDPDLGIALFIEGEEEFGSESFGAILAAHADVLRADAVIVADSDNWTGETPSITVGLRGNAAVVVTVSTLDHAVHSGMFGGAIPDAPLAAIKLINSLWDEHGAVAVPGLVHEHFDYPDYNEDRLREESGLLPGVSTVGEGHILSRMWAKPAITVTGSDLPSLINASNTALPRVRFKLSVRIAPSQDPAAAAQAIREHLERNAPFGAKVELEFEGPNPGYMAKLDGWAATLLTDAMTETWPNPPLHTGIGGSIPFINELVDTFPDIQVLVTGVEDADSRAHSPNESLLLSMFKRAIASQALFLARANEREL